MNEKAFKNTLLGNQMLWSSSEGDSGRKYPPITDYSTPTCGFCTKLKNILKKNGIPFKDIDIARDSKAGENLVKRTGQQGVPQTFIGSTHIDGIDQQKIDKLLGIKA